MDAKALAKSKRAHSVQNSRRHQPNQKPKAPSSVASQNKAGDAKKSSGKQAKEKPFQSRSKSALPSNWDRYEEENDSGSEGPSGTGASQDKKLDFVLPKSKGADYRYLIGEAESQSHVFLDSFPSVDDVLAGDFGQAVGSMLSVKGEGILAWCGDDNFIVEDGSIAHPEAAFLSLNLHALAEQLEKIDLEQRLFIDADLLLPELRGGVSKTSSSDEFYQMRATNDVEAIREQSEELTFNEVSSSSSLSGGYPDHSLSARGSSSVSQSVPDVQRISQYNHRSDVPDSAAQSAVDSFADQGKKTPEFEAVAAEAELDMLLDSFNEIKILDPSSSSSADGLTVQKEASAAAFQRNDPVSSVLTSANLDDDLDDLLNETSGLASQNSLLQPQGGRTDLLVQSSSPKSGTKSKALDDFDSWLDTL